ncbi:uncharacterized protein ATNIH1004_008085 [Aspergillus tanneri]|uniref:Amidase domain-containing protein n=1 Tax=Aspergillus tanneri TaxID=1220188 RepID=A0A5M9MHF0_9EURO|nr:uncharacterized protein ATNIH1004_008085 [Aspergillus tanneri]KAA8643889.1 hypothetical protein ATNIH1004_008085 [Aspergillus tanneri]
MRGAMVGFGADFGGSIHVPAMCNNIYGFKPSAGRIPFGGLESGRLHGQDRISMQAVAGPLAVADLEAVMKRDCPESGPVWWRLYSRSLGEKFSVIARDQVERVHCWGVTNRWSRHAFASYCTSHGRGSRVSPSDSRCLGSRSASPSSLEGLAGRLMGVDDAGSVRTPRSVVEQELLTMWPVNGDYTNRIDAIIAPVAPHPVPEIDRYNSIGYTSSFVLLDYPAGTIPVRRESGRHMDSPILGSWDRVNRELWDNIPLTRLRSVVCKKIVNCLLPF